MLVQILKDGAESMRKKNIKAQTHNASIEKRKDLLLERAYLREQRFEHPLEYEHISQEIHKHDKICKNFVAANTAERIENLTEALIEAKNTNIARQEHRIAHLLAAQARGAARENTTLPQRSNRTQLNT
jgi:hypothetical protein